MCWLNVNQLLHGISQRPNVYWNLQSFVWVSYQNTVKRTVMKTLHIFIKLDCLASERSGRVQQSQDREVKVIS